TSHFDVPEHLRPPICAEEAVGICKRVKRIHDPVKIMVPCAVFEVESPIPPDKVVYLSSYIETSHIDVPEHLRPPICAEEAVRICKRVKSIHDPVKIMVPCAVFEVESPIPPDKVVYLSSYIE
ncbi:hypothetical protein HID58_025259, partial [Brassica napus]